MKTIENKVISIEDLVGYFNAGQLHKPDFQRDKRWKYEHNLRFLEFTFEINRVLTSFLCTEQTSRIYSVFDGNNRINAIIDFYQTPLKYLTKETTAFEMALQNKSDNKCCKILCNKIKLMSYDKLCSTTSVRSVCRENAGELWEWYRKNDDLDETIETAYSLLHNALTRLKFNQIKLNFEIFIGYSPDEIIYIYKNINTTGVPLSDLDLLKATCSLTFYHANEQIPVFSDLLACMRKYIEEQNDKELLNVDLPTTQLSAYQILFALQLYLHKMYPYIIDEPGKTKDGLDTTFKLYMYFYKDLNNKDINAVTTFINKITNIFIQLNNVYKKLFGIDTDTKMFGTGGKNKLSHVVGYMFIIYENINIKNVLKIILYNKLCECLKNTNDKVEETINSFKLKNPINYVAEGGALETSLKKISENPAAMEIPSSPAMCELLTYLIQNSYKPCSYSEKKRQYKPSLLETIVLNVYFYARVPPALAEQKLNLDHIIPVGLKGWENSLDINCIGNKMLIPECANKKKSNNPITKEFLQEHGLNCEYINYITTDEYNTIVENEVLTNVDAFNAFCKKRETQYVNGIIKYLY